MRALEEAKASIDVAEGHYDAQVRQNDLLRTEIRQLRRDLQTQRTEIAEAKATIVLQGTANEIEALRTKNAMSEGTVLNLRATIDDQAMEIVLRRASVEEHERTISSLRATIDDLRNTERRLLKSEQIKMARISVLEGQVITAEKQAKDTDELLRMSQDTVRELHRGVSLTVPADLPGLGTQCRVERDKFVGDVIGYYKTRRSAVDKENWGIVLKQNGTEVVHVYRAKWVVPVVLKNGDTYGMTNRRYL